MKKNTIKAFTLVEMLIVIVIIGILIAALMPRMQAAQWRARDVSRKTALSQIQSAIVVSQWDKWRWPGCDSNWCSSWNLWMDIKSIETELKAAWMNSTPKDPIQWNKVTWLWTYTATDWEFGYLVGLRNWTSNGWFVLMAKTEVEWGSNWVTCSGATTIGQWKILSSEDISKINLCETVERNSWWNGTCVSNTGSCKYNNDDELRYVVIY